MSQLCDKSLECICVELLAKNKLHISTMESCTGGMIASKLVNVSGASEVFEAGYVTYSNQAKHEILGVKLSTLEKYTAVSKEVAKEMVEGIGLKIRPDVAVSVTGLAGPLGGSAEKPVGLVYIGCRVKEKTLVKEYHFSGDRLQIRQAATEAALLLLRDCILAYFNNTL